MLKIFLTVLTLLTLGFVEAQVNIFDDCIVDCADLYEVCISKDEACLYFEDYFVLGNHTWFKNSTEFIEFAEEICEYGSFNGTQIVCGVFVKDLIECIAYSSCWNNNTGPYNSDCTYYAQVVTDVTVVTQLPELEICFEPWEALFGFLFDDSHCGVEVNFLNNNCAFNYSNFEWNNSLYSNDSGGESTISFQLTLTFYSEYSYVEFVDNMDGTDVSTLFGSSLTLNETFIYATPFTTECCTDLSSVEGTGDLDIICVPATASTTGSGGETTGTTTQSVTTTQNSASTTALQASTTAQQASTTAQQAATTTQLTATTQESATTTQSHKSGAISIKPFFNFMIIFLILIFAYMF